MRKDVYIAVIWYEWSSFLSIIVTSLLWIGVFVMFSMTWRIRILIDLYILYRYFVKWFNFVSIMYVQNIFKIIYLNNIYISIGL